MDIYGSQAWVEKAGVGYSATHLRFLIFPSVFNSLETGLNTILLKLCSTFYVSLNRHSWLNRGYSAAPCPFLEVGRWILNVRTL